MKREALENKQAFESAMLSKTQKEVRETQRQNIVTGVSMISTQLGNFFANPKFLVKTAYLSLMVFSAYYGTRMAFGVLGQRLMARFGKPQLIRETSKLYTNNVISLPFMYLRKFALMRMRRSEKDLLNGVILDKRLQEQIREISYAVLNRKQHFAPCKNMMFFGPPGTGKTLFAKKLAMQSGLEYAVMVGSDIAPLGKDAVTELNKIFDWAEKQPNGMILFIDEADAFLRDRQGKDMSEDMRHTINSFLYRTGSPSDKVVLVMATNTPDHLDAAVHDRIDEVVNFGLPSVSERQTMLFHYLVKYCQPPQSTWEKATFLYRYPRSIYTGKKLIRMENIDKELIEKIAAQTEGFSGREIMKMTVAWHDAAFTTTDLVLTPDIMEKVLQKFKLQHQLKATWTRDEALLYGKMADL
jgi:ATPase family AAA domain-containing protein 3A/B